jgi:hypothetical protein
MVERSIAICQVLPVVTLLLVSVERGPPPGLLHYCFGKIEELKEMVEPKLGHHTKFLVVTPQYQSYLGLTATTECTYAAGLYSVCDLLCHWVGNCKRPELRPVFTGLPDVPSWTIA